MDDQHIIPKHHHKRSVKEKRDAYIKRLNGIYVRNLGNSNVEIIEGYGTFVSKLLTVKKIIRIECDIR